MSNQFDRTLNPDTGFALLLLPLPGLASRPGNTGMKKKKTERKGVAAHFHWVMAERYIVLSKLVLLVSNQ